MRTISRCSENFRGEPQGTLATARHYVGDLVYGANDGLITTFAVVAAASRATRRKRVPE
jgi:hypothetical protein